MIHYRYILPTLSTCLLILMATCGVIYLSGCSSDSPEDQVRSFIKTAEDAVEKNEIGDVKAMISENYSDNDGMTKKDIIAYLSYQLLRKRSIHLFTSIDQVKFPAEDQAEVVLFVAMTGQPVESASILPKLQADIYRFDLILQNIDGNWLLATSTWQPALIEDIFTE
ncbi:hypothetical protein [Desulfopila sp. IMCC35008]|uniref:hypothetical protein n=1 Tax=Desulfopila sp. IMCC35008 TaxID=2653858 RepID=UPI0013D35D5D|nr:hypothetical protein [Desulfopila sp. IMCC35008]